MACLVKLLSCQYTRNEKQRTSRLCPVKQSYLKRPSRERPSTPIPLSPALRYWCTDWCASLFPTPPGQRRARGRSRGCLRPRGPRPGGNDREKLMPGSQGHTANNSVPILTSGWCAHGCDQGTRTPLPPSLFHPVSKRSHIPTWAGCIVSLTTRVRSSLKASRTV